MYEPKHFRIEDRDELFAVIRAHPLGLLISNGADGIEANPVPFVLAREEGRDILRCHLARANGQWKSLAASSEALIVFHGTNHYVTPSWYAAKREHGRVVPTWNYVHVQVRGRASVHEDTTFLAAQIAALTEAHEGARVEPWAIGDAPEAFVAAQMRGIVGVEIGIERISGKFKLSQNRSEADFAGVVAGLSSESDDAGPAMSAFMREKDAMLRPESPKP